jgi:hypothetical protein
LIVISARSYFRRYRGVPEVGAGGRTVMSENERLPSQEPKQPPVRLAAKAWRAAKPVLDLVAVIAAYRQLDALVAAVQVVKVLGPEAVDWLQRRKNP